jgi:hypothetical protein
MDFSFTKEQELFREEVKEFLKNELPIERQKIGICAEVDKEFHKKLAERGYLAICWPKEYGGAGRSHIDLAIFHEEMGYARAPMGSYVETVIFVALSIMSYGSEEQKNYFIPKIAKGEIKCCWALTEPNAGSDAANIQTTAIEDGDHYIINGTKIFISGANVADWAMSLIRTTKGLKKHEGLTMFLIDMKSEGITVNPLYTLGGGRVNEIVFDGVRVPKKNIMGEKDRGWYFANVTLDLERSGISGVGEIIRIFEELKDYLKDNKDSYPSWRYNLLRHRLADMATKIEVAKLFSYRVAWLQDKGVVPHVEAAMAKYYSTELYQDIAELGFQILGERGLLEGWYRNTWNSSLILLNGIIPQMYRSSMILRVAGGSSEIQKNIIAIRGLGLPR